MAKVSALDVAKHILVKQGTSMATMKLQKLVYYSQAWHVTWTGKPLFNDEIQAWANGPVTRNLFDHHKGMYSISASQLAAGQVDRLGRERQSVVDIVLDTYGPMSGTQLSMLTHAEAPWLNARGHLSAGDKSAATITTDSMRDFYKELSQSADAVHDIADVNFPAWA